MGSADSLVRVAERMILVEGQVVSSARLLSVQKHLRNAGLDALVCRLPENVLCLTGYAPLNGVSFLLVPASDAPLLIAPQVDDEILPRGEIKTIVYPWGRVDDPSPLTSIRRILGACTRIKTLAWEEGFEAVAPTHVAGEVLVPARQTRLMLHETFPDATMVDGTGLLEEERAIKTTEEVACMKRSCSIAEFGVVAFEEAVRPGVTEAEVLASVEAAIIRHGLCFDGAYSVRAFAQLLSGQWTSRAWSPAYISGQRSIVQGDIVLLELATVVNGYWSDLTRVCVAGRPDAYLCEIRHAVDEAVDAACRTAKPGVPAFSVDAAAREVLRNAGLDGFFPHHTGHGVGFRYHEPVPFLHPRSDHILVEGMTCTIEPGVYVEGWGGVRIEENIVVTATGGHLLSIPARGGR